MGINESVMSMQPGARGVLVQRFSAAFSGVGYACAAWLFLTVGTAVWWTCGLFKRETAVEIVASVATASLNFASVLLLPLLLVVAASNLAPAAGVRRVLAIGATTLLAVAACMMLAHVLPLGDADATAAGTAAQAAELVVMLVLVLEFRHRTLAAASALLRSEIDAVAADARLQRVRLDVLRAQIAPHFLFNTLANVRRLARVDRSAAASMLGDLAHYFSITLAPRDDAASTLATESDLVDAYLRIHCIRMGARLTYALRLPTELGGARLPPMMLLTLVENAIKHGIDPLVEGGCVEIAAEQHGAMLQLEVADNGRGMASSEGHGMGLANIRARLAMLYGSRARLSLAHRQPRGFVASVQLPLEYVR
jgi:signal transduction histidine kinase